MNIHFTPIQSTVVADECEELSFECHSAAVSHFRVCILQRSIWRLITSQRCTKAPPIAAHKCSLLFPLFGGCTTTVLRGFTYPKILCTSKKMKARKNMATSHGCIVIFTGLGSRNRDVRVRMGTSGDTTRHAPKARLPHLTTALSQFRVCVLQGTQALTSSKASPSERPC